MIRMIQSTSGGHAKSYFSEALSKADYYIDDQELQGKFRGELANRIGISELATKEVFYDLCDNLNPVTKTQLTGRTKEDRTVGYDINFHCPKSVSLVHALSKDEHILKAFEDSVVETMKDVEADAMTRVRKDGKSEDRKTGELLYADFIHQTARPVDGYTPDPHLHAHCFVFNVTYDEVEKSFKAGQFRDIKRDMPYYQARFHKRLADKLVKAGYRVCRTDKSFEIEGVPKKAIELFSKRTDEIGRVAKEKGITSQKELAELGARTRAKKDKGMSMSELKEDWKRQISQLEMDESDRGKVIRDMNRILDKKVTSKECVEHALKHTFERASVMADRRILEQAYRYGMGESSISVDEIQSTFDNNKTIIRVKEKNRIVCTTREVLLEEKMMVELARQGQGAMKPLYWESPELSLVDQQAAAVDHILTTSNRVSIIRGAAGAGKTTLMKEAVAQIEKSGKSVTVIAPTSQASRGVLRVEGFAEAETVAKFLYDEAAQKAIENQVLWVDEAGLLGTQDMKALLNIATEKNARLILGGDTRQHSSVARGDALRVLNTVGGIQAAEVTKIFRQREKEYRDAVKKLSEGDVKSAFEKLDAIESIKSCDSLDLNKELAGDYFKALRAGKSALVISPTHQQGDTVTEILRKQMRASKLLGKREISVQRLINTNLTEAQRGDIRNFKEGHVLQFNQNLKGIKRGGQWSIYAEESGKLRMKNNKNESMDIPLVQAKSFDVYDRSEINLAKGDKVAITKNGYDLEDKRLDNGTALEVLAVKKNGEVLLKQSQSKARYKIKSDFSHLSHAYCVTSHASQGKTVDEVFISQPAGTFAATDAKQFYVSVSRGRDKARIYTDDKIGLLEHAAEIGNRQSALEMIAKHESQVESSYRRDIEMIQREEQIRQQQEQLRQNKQSKDNQYEP